jgi:hypothetical protein
MGANQWREFWASRGMRELRVVLRDSWEPARDAPPDADAHAFRIASLLGSRAPASALAEELGRIRRDELSAAADPDEDARAAEAIGEWFRAAARPA